MKVRRISKTKRIIVATERQSFRAVSEAVKTAESTMRRLVPKDTGFLDSTIQSTDDGKGKGQIEVGAEYGMAVEFGQDGTIPGQPYFRPGLDDGRTALKRNMKIKEG